MTRMPFMNTEIDSIDFREAVERCCAFASGKSCGHYVVTPNVDHIVRLENDRELREVYANADLVLTDGKPLIWISKAYGTPIAEKISGSDLFPALCEQAAKRGLSMYFFGAAPGVAAKAADNLQSRYPGLNVVGVRSPEFGFEKDVLKEEAELNAINVANPDILVVGLGCPKQEKFVYRNRGRLKARLSLGLGASLDFEAGNIQRAPKWMQDHGLEWLYRISQDPGRLAKRYLVDDVKIISLAVKYRKGSN